MKKLNKKGFSIVEIAVVVVVIGVVGSVVFYANNRIKDRSSLADTANSITIDASNYQSRYHAQLTMNQQSIVRDNSLGTNVIQMRSSSPGSYFMTFDFNRNVLPNFSFQDGAKYKICVKAKVEDQNTIIRLETPGYTWGPNTAYLDSRTNGYVTTCTSVARDGKDAADYFYYRSGAGSTPATMDNKISMWTERKGQGSTPTSARIAWVQVTKIGEPMIRNEVYSDNTLTSDRTNSADVKNQESVEVSQQQAARVWSDEFQITSRKERLNTKLFIDSRPTKSFKVCVSGRSTNPRVGSVVKIVDWLGAQNITYTNETQNTTKCSALRTYAQIRRGLDNYSTKYSVEYVSGAPFTADKISVVAQ